MYDFTRREVAIIAAGLLVATVLVVVGTWYLVEVFVQSDARDPLTKARGLNATQDVRNK